MKILLPSSTTFIFIMKTIDIKGTLRTEVGKKASKSLRKEGMVPCNLYGGEKNINFYAHENEFRKIIYTPDVFEINIDIEGSKHKAIVQEFQFHPVKDNVIHIDFIEVTDKKPIKAAIPVKLVGAAKGVLDGGRMVLNLRRLKAKGLISDMPEAFEINVDHLVIGKGIKIGDLNFDKIELLDPSNSIVCAVKVTRVALSEEAVEEDEEGAESEEGAEATAEGSEASTDKAKE